MVTRKKYIIVLGILVALLVGYYSLNTEKANQNWPTIGSKK